MHLANQRRQYVRGFGVIVVSRAVEIGRHRRQKLRPVLPVVRRAHFDTRNLGDRIRPVCRFQWPGEKVFLLYRLRAVARVNARRTEKKQTLYTGFPCLINDVGLDGDVLLDKLSRVGVIGDNAAHFGCCKEHVFGLLGLEEFANRLMIGQVEIGVRPLEQVSATCCIKTPNDCRPGQPVVTGDIDPGVRIHRHS